MVKLELTTTGDGSHTLFNSQTGEHYHSIHGAIQESGHVFINAGLRSIAPRSEMIHILEVGFGTGLNCLLTFAEHQILAKPVTYTACEPFPISKSLVGALNYCRSEGLQGFEPVFSDMHQKPEGKTLLGNDFLLIRLLSGLEETELPEGSFDLVYFDAFSPEAQPELWKPEIFRKIRRSMKPGGALVTYCAKGLVRRTLQQAGFSAERLPGPPGKREMLRATAI